MPFRNACLLCLAIFCSTTQPCAAATAAVPGIDLTQLPQSWIDDDGQALSLAAMRGHRLVLTMAYATCHRFCPATIDELQRIQQRADQRTEALVFLVISYDPANDTPRVWRAYRHHRRLERPNWHFVHGSPSDTRRLARQLGFPFWIYDEHVIHEPHAVVFDAAGAVQAVLDSHVTHWSETF